MCPCTCTCSVRSLFFVNLYSGVGLACVVHMPCFAQFLQTGLAQDCMLPFWLRNNLWRRQFEHFPCIFPYGCCPVCTSKLDLFVQENFCLCLVTMSTVKTIVEANAEMSKALTDPSAPSGEEAMVKVFRTVGEVADHVGSKGPASDSTTPRAVVFEALELEDVAGPETLVKVVAAIKEAEFEATIAAIQIEKMARRSQSLKHSLVFAVCFTRNVDAAAPAKNPPQPCNHAGECFQHRCCTGVSDSTVS